MGRWEPDPRGRLLHAALELFATQGYDATTAAQIAERAGLTKATLFRQFADKREILFQGQPAAVELVQQTVRAGPDADSPDRLVDRVLDALVDEHVPEQQAIGAAIAALTATVDALRERAVYKRFVLTATLEAELTERLGDADAAGLLAETAMRAYHQGFDRWTLAGDGAALGPLVHDELDRLRTAAAVLSAS